MSAPVSGLSALAAPRDYVLDQPQFNFLRQLVNERTGIVLSDAKQEMVYGRLMRRIRALGLPGFAEYCALLRQHPEQEIGALINAITTNLTSFFREPHHFDFLRDVALPEWVRTKGRVPRARLWSAGCSTGEEPYSVAMTVYEALGRRAENVAILGTDIDTNVLALAETGIYPLERIDSLEASYRASFLRGTGANRDKIKVKPEIAGLIRFRPLNLVGHWPVIAPVDLVFCRNVVIYFNKNTQRQLFARFANALTPGGYLIIGHAETLFNISERFELIGRTIYRKRP